MPTVSALPIIFPDLLVIEGNPFRIALLAIYLLLENNRQRQARFDLRVLIGITEAQPH